jgi:hypothetical protein
MEQRFSDNLFHPEKFTFSKTVKYSSCSGITFQYEKAFQTFRKFQKYGLNGQIHGGFYFSNFQKLLLHQ